jgi:hypothetical protein
LLKARGLLAMVPREEKPQAAKATETAPPPLPCRCPRCGGRMIVTLVFAHRWAPDPRASPVRPIRLDTS